MREKSKFVIFFIALALIVSLFTACSSGGSEETVTDQTDPDATSSESGDEVVELTMFVNHPWWTQREWGGAVAEEITKQTGVKLNIQVAADDNQLSLMMASGDLPDLVFTADNVDRMADPKLSYAWNELIEEYAPSFEIDKTRKAVNTVSDENFYTILNAFSTEEEWNSNDKALPGAGSAGLAVREDIMEELGNPEIKSLTDFENVLMQVKENYDGMLPLVMDINHLGGFFKAHFGIDVGPTAPWYERDGELFYETRHPGYLEYYKYMNRLYRNGLITAENFTFADDQRDDQMVLSGDAFAHMYVMRVADANNTNLEKQGEDFRYKLLTESISEDTVYINSMIGWSGVFITKNNKNPEASIKLMEFMLSEEGQKLGLWGIEGEHWTWNEEGYPQFNYDVNDEEYKGEEGIYWWGLLGGSAVSEGIGNYVPGLQSTEGFQMAKERTIYRPELGLVNPDPDTEERNILTSIQEMIKNEETKIYLAKSEEEAVAAYEQMMANAEKIGIEQLEEWATEEYQSVIQFFE
ncbi:extracellular solute-binding protein [Bacillus solitudinis]|uniref:extracellular solute-binding protein n=1 Tax=Bacillus solitudinis TaxID=2014074 RepID=UPI000C24D866|nr:extracellular solute-binding protein [Bacillus solitudinis]